MKAFALVAPLSAAMILSACATTGDEMATTMPMPMARATLAAGDGTPKGTATISEVPGGLKVVVNATGQTPGTHAVHIHMTGQCTGPDFTSAGGHWNPTNQKHGRDNPQGMHMGDMPNMTVAADGTGSIEYLVPQALLRSGATPLLDADGAAVVIHAQADDYKSDPTGNAGGRAACGVITAN